jgi:hypothetical protein
MAYICRNCGNYVAPTSKICPTCRIKFTGVSDPPMGIGIMIGMVILMPIICMFGCGALFDWMSGWAGGWLMGIGLVFGFIFGLVGAIREIVKNLRR